MIYFFKWVLIWLVGIVGFVFLIAGLFAYLQKRKLENTWTELTQLNAQTSKIEAAVNALSFAQIGDLFKSWVGAVLKAGG